jgi:hypothetical protein
MQVNSSSHASIGYRRTSLHSNLERMCERNCKIYLYDKPPQRTAGEQRKDDRGPIAHCSAQWPCSLFVPKFCNLLGHRAGGAERNHQENLYDTVFPLGNADALRLDLADGRKVLVDFGNQGDPDGTSVPSTAPTAAPTRRSSATTPSPHGARIMRSSARRWASGIYRLQH